MCRTAVLDFETTGLTAGEDEIIQASVIDEEGNILMNEYFCPEHHAEWPDAQKVNGISPADVAGLPPFSSAAKRLQELLSGAGEVIAYNDSFEKSFLDAAGIPSARLHWGSDPMLLFAAQTGGTRRKLEAAAGFFGYDFHAHNALEDVRATLLVYNMVKNHQLLRNLAKDAVPAWGQTAAGPAAYRAPDPENMLRILKCLGLCPFTARKPKTLWYKGVFADAPCECECTGIRDRSADGEWLVLAVESAGKTYLVTDDYLREMQAAGYGRSDAPQKTQPAQRRASPAKQEKALPPQPAKKQGGQNNRFASFARKNEAMKKIETNENADPENPLFGKSIVFTGDLSIPREDAAAMAAGLGAYIKSGVSGKTDYLVTGAQDPGLVGSDGRSGKEQKAAQLNESGKGHIEILDEAGFLALIQSAQNK